MTDNVKMKSRSNSDTNGGRLSNDDEDEEKNTFATMAREYLEMTLMHGIPFIINPRASNFERFSDLKEIYLMLTANFYNITISNKGSMVRHVWFKFCLCCNLRRSPLGTLGSIASPHHGRIC